MKIAGRYLTKYAADVPLVAGTDAFFAELNRGRPPIELLDERNVREAMLHAERHPAAVDRINVVKAGALALVLLPHAYARLDWPTASAACDG